MTWTFLSERQNRGFKNIYISVHEYSLNLLRLHAQTLKNILVQVLFIIKSYLPDPPVYVSVYFFSNHAIYILNQNTLTWLVYHLRNFRGKKMQSKLIAKKKRVVHKNCKRVNINIRIYTYIIDPDEKPYL